MGRRVPRVASPHVETRLDALAPELDALLTLVALVGPSASGRLLHLALAAGICDKSERQHDKQSMRARLLQLVELGWVATDGTTYFCLRGRDQEVLRRAGRKRRLLPLVATVARAEFSVRTYYGAGPQLQLEARAALAEGSEKLETVVAALVTLTSVGEVVGAVIAPGFDAFDAAWFERLKPSFREQWTGLALGRIEAEGRESAALTEYFGARLEQEVAHPEQLLPLAGIAIQRGDRALLEKVIQASSEETRAAIQAAMAVVDGSYGEAADRVPVPRKGTPHGTGLVAILNALALVMRTRPEDLELARRLATAGSRKGLPMRDSFRELKVLVELVSRPDGDDTATNAPGHSDPSDCVAALLRLLSTEWFERASANVSYMVSKGIALSKRCEASGLAWMKSQVDYTTYVLGQRALQAPLAFRTPKLELKPPEPPPAAPLLALRAEKAAWELVLEGLERFAEKSGPGERSEKGQNERLIWRVRLENRQLEPYVQKRTANGYTKGRALALTQLLPGGAMYPKLPPEDARVAASARDNRTSYRGWAHVTQHFEPQAFLALVGHPRVYLEGSDTPVEVVRGQVELVVRRDGDQLNVHVEPPGFEGNLRLVSDGRRLTVYFLEASAEPLLKWLGSELSLPVAAQPRALAVLGRLSHLVPVQSFEGTDARRVAADPTPWLRIQPRGAGLSIALSVRPLGAVGPQVKPGHGAPTLLGHVENQFVQADRDLSEEQRLTRELLSSCEALAASEIGDYAYELSEPTDCLDLVSTLRRLERGVHVEWPQGKPLRLRAALSRKSLRGSVRRAGDFFLATGSLEVDSELTLELEELLRLAGDSTGRFLRLENGDYLEIERELREIIEALSSAQSSRAPHGARTGLRGVALGKSAVSSLEELFRDGSPFQLDQDSRQFRDKLAEAFSKKPKLPRTLRAELRPYQEEGFVWLARLAELELGACLADDMGLGKTVQILALLLSRVKSGPALVVAPVSVCDNWRTEIARFAPSLRVRWYMGPGRECELEKLGNGDLVITSYALLQQDIERLQTIEFGTAVLDEAQFIKNADSLRARAASGLTSRMRIAATGTPVENHVGDLFGIFQFLMPDLLGTKTGFNKRFPLASEGEVGAAARRRLRRLIQPFVLRRTKAQVLSELPELTEIRRTVTLTPEEAALYESLRRTAIAKLAEGATGGVDPRERFQVLAEITRLRRLCCHPNLVIPEPKLESSKLATFLEIVDELVEGKHRALVFSQFVDMLALVREALDAHGVSYQYLDGKTPHAQRKAAVDAFQAGDGDLFLISLRAGGFGLNLTGADYVIHLDPWWNPAVEAQASDRAHRIGQTRPVTVYRLVTAKTVEDRIIELHRTKRELADTLLEDTDAAAKLGADELRALLES
jgi:superfamily II DNA or RNA helicase